MVKTATIRLGETAYTVRAFNMGEIEEVAAIFETEPVVARRAFAVVRLALKVAATPKVDDPDALDVTIRQVGDASNAIMELSGLRSAPAGEARAAPAAA